MIILVIYFYLLLYIIIKMAKVAMMTSGLTRRQTYEEVLDYIENDPDKIKYPNRTAKYLRNTFQLNQLNGMGQALFEQQQIDEMKDKVKISQNRKGNSTR